MRDGGGGIQRQPVGRAPEEARFDTPLPRRVVGLRAAVIADEHQL